MKNKNNRKKFENCLVCEKKLTGRQEKYCSDKCKKAVYYQKDKDKISEWGKIYRKKNKEKISGTRKMYREKNKEKIREEKKLDYEKNKDKIIQRVKNYYEQNKEEIRKKGKIHYEKNKEKIKERISKYAEQNKPQRREYYKKNKKSFNEKRREYEKIRLKEDSEYVIKERVRKYFLRTFKRFTTTKKLKTSKDYGINFTEIIEKLKPFPIDIKNYHIDHIKPLSSFKFRNADGSINYEAIKEAWSPENLQWLTAEENMKKRDKNILD